MWDIRTIDWITWNTDKLKDLGVFFVCCQEFTTSVLCCVAVQPVPALRGRGVCAADGRSAVSHPGLWGRSASRARPEENPVWARQRNRLWGKNLLFPPSGVGNNWYCTTNAKTKGGNVVGFFIFSLALNCPSHQSGIMQLARQFKYSTMAWEWWLHRGECVHSIILCFIWFKKLLNSYSKKLNCANENPNALFLLLEFSRN